MVLLEGKDPKNICDYQKRSTMSHGGKRDISGRTKMEIVLLSSGKTAWESGVIIHKVKAVYSVTLPAGKRVWLFLSSGWRSLFILLLCGLFDVKSPLLSFWEKLLQISSIIIEENYPDALVF